ncbi:cupin domain-containing protein [Halorientalis pallida]|uniref:Cupin domain-containing protein n=1 Tax=Halorientalis pallida TaxID=2479928 RepID=A0A498L3A0_9EURY|nr:cupin domain-containing protein [Halorientalis pallida]RXK51104.1 cupin domain-containing protein [Halorientalis pallida]
MPSTVTLGRTIDEHGDPIPDTGIDVDPDGPIADRLADRTGPLISNPLTGEWVTELVPATETDGETATGLGVFAAGNDGPPEHYHVGYEESFEVIRGEFHFEVDGDVRHATAGDELTVPPEVPHSFRNVGEEIGATVTTTRPAGQTQDVITTLYGLAHEGKLDEDAEPGLLQGLAMTAATSDDTVFTSPPPAVTVPMAKVLGPVANALGYQATYPKYLSELFWNNHVEQPTL